MADFERVSSGAPWEKKLGYCRAVRARNHIFVSGTTSVADDGTIYGKGNPYLQTKRCFEIIEKAVGRLGASMHNVVRTRMFVTDISQWQEYGRAHGEIFATHPPASSIIGVNALIDKDMMVEIEVDLVI